MQEALAGAGNRMADWGFAGPVIEVKSCDKLLCDGCRTGDIEVVRQALKDGANPSVQLRLALGEITPIFLCASKGYAEIAELLIEANRDIINHRMGFDGTTCLHHAASNDQAEMCSLLIKHGCDVNKKDHLERTPLMDAAEIGAEQVIAVLLENHCDPDLMDKEHHTAISYCLDFISKDEPKFLHSTQLLIQHGANANFAGKFTGRTLLHYAAAQGNLELVKQLIEDHRAHISPLDEDRKTPLVYAKEKDQDEVVEYLEQAIPGASGCPCVIM